jgi:hypothetical protein
VNGMTSMPCDDMCETFVQPALLQVNTIVLMLSHNCITTSVSRCDARSFISKVFMSQLPSELNQG